MPAAYMCRHADMPPPAPKLVPSARASSPVINGYHSPPAALARRLACLPLAGHRRALFAIQWKRFSFTYPARSCRPHHGRVGRPRQWTGSM